MSGLLSYDVLFCTSEDPANPVSQLAGGAVEGKAGSDASLTGWQSARNGKVPQTLVLRFHGNVWLQQLRILSHESKIATRVEVRVAKLGEDDDFDNPPSFRNVRFVKLGSVDFNSNEQSHYKSKERKTVHLKTEAYFLKLLFDRPYINVFNAGQQIGLYSLECSGHVVTPIAAHADDEPIIGGSSRPGSFARRPTREERPTKTATDLPVAAPLPPLRAAAAPLPAEPVPGRPLRAGLSTSGRSSSSPVGGSSSPVGLGTAFRSVRILEFEDFFLRRSEELVSLKEEAVAVEDFSVAAQCRDKLVTLNKGAKEMYEMEQDKVQAIIDENFEVAQQVKVRMNDLVSRLFAQTALPLPEEGAEGGEAAAASESSASNGDGNENDATHCSSPGEAIAATGGTQRVVDAEALPTHESAIARAILTSAGSEDGSTVVMESPGFDVQPLMAAVGAFPTACLLSRRFKLREAALVVITEHPDMFASAPQVVEDAVLRFLDHNAYGLQDSIPNVVFAACTFIRMALSDAAGCLNSVLSPVVALLPRLLTRCSDNLQRVRDEALTTLTLYVKTPAIPASTILSATLMDPTDKERRKLPYTNAKAQLSRLNLFQLVVEQGRLHVEGNAALSDNLLQRLLLPAVNHPNPEVRDVAVSILGKLVATRQMTIRDKDLAAITNTGIRDGIASKRA